MDVFDFPVTTPLVTVIRSTKQKTTTADRLIFTHFVGVKQKGVQVQRALSEVLESWQWRDLKEWKQEILSWDTSHGPVQVVKPQKVDKATGKGPQGLLGRSLFAAWVELGGLWASKIPENTKAVISLWGLSPIEVRGLFCGMEMGRYKYRDFTAGKKYVTCTVVLKAGGENKAAWSEVQKGQELGQSVNLARHLINTPPNMLYPLAFARQITKALKSFPHMKVEVWNKGRLEKENMRLHLAVGQGSAHEPCLVKISYRPAGGKSQKPVAFVGKGVTFDTGGLDLKPSSAMRLMKKDMGGAASLAGLAWWVAQSRPKVACDFYLPMAENAVGSNSFRPSDIIKSRSGQTVEIDNTDAEGRLVLADSLTLAQESGPRVVINLATLTGAIKASLGTELPGLFSNRDELAGEILLHGFEYGDLCWQMPLYAPMARGLKSPVADMVNSTNGFGGAVTAALFLQKFVGDTPWAHVDIYGWQDKAEGAYAESGGKGQMVLALTRWLESL